MEAAAARGFATVSSLVMDRCLRDVEVTRDVKSPHERAAVLIKAWHCVWGWSQVDCARALAGVLPHVRKRRRATPKVPQDEAEQLPWGEISSILAALEGAAVPEEPPISQSEARNLERQDLVAALNYDFDRVARRSGSSCGQNRNRRVSKQGSQGGKRRSLVGTFGDRVCFNQV